MIIEQKLRKRVQFHAQKLVDKIHSRAHYARSVGTYGVGDMSYTDGVQVLVVARVLNEGLSVQIVEVLRHKDVNISHDLKCVQALLQRLCW